jgi:D-lyxose ketol-isomerase
MITTKELRRRQSEALRLFRHAAIHLTAAERRAIEIADFGLNAFEETGLGVLVYVNTDRCCAKELAMWPGQTCPQHRHPPVGSDPGKEETFRCRWGRVHLFIEGTKTRRPGARPPPAPRGAYTVGHEIILRPGAQFTLRPGLRHWFQAGPDGAVVSEFSTRSTDENDLFDDVRIQRITQVV